MTIPGPGSRKLPLASKSPRRLRAAALLLCLASALGCREGGGSGSETTLSGITGKVVDAEGNPVPGAAIYIRPEGSLPPGLPGTAGSAGGAGELPWAYAAIDGGFRIAGLAPGDYVAEFRAAPGAAVLDIRAADTLVRLPDAVLRPAGAIRGRVRGLSDGLTQMYGAFVYIPGLLSRALIYFEGRDTVEFLLGDVPAGVRALRVRPAYPIDLEHYKAFDLPAIAVAPGDTVDVGALNLPARAGTRDSAYSRDSAAVAALLRANGVDERTVPEISGAMGDRITMLFDFQGRIRKLTPDLATLDQLDLLNLMKFSEAIDLEGAAEIARLRGLRQLQIINCRLDGSPEWLGDLPKLEELVLGGVGLRRFPDELEALPFLQRLSLWNDSIGELPGSVSRMKRLQVLDVSGAGLTGLPAALAGMPLLYKAYFERNRFIAVPPVLLAMDKLRLLDLSGNELASLPDDLMRMPALRGFRARGNRLCGLSREWKDWLKLQDSLWYAAADTSLNAAQVRAERDSGWEASQRCPGP